MLGKEVGKTSQVFAAFLRQLNMFEADSYLEQRIICICQTINSPEFAESSCDHVGKKIYLIKEISSGCYGDTQPPDHNAFHNTCCQGHSYSTYLAVEDNNVLRQMLPSY